MKTLLASTALSLSSLALSSTAMAADGPPPPSVNQPAGINLGGTRFFDGFAGPPGWSHLVYLKYSSVVCPGAGDR